MNERRSPHPVTVFCDVLLTGALLAGGLFAYKLTNQHDMTTAQAVSDEAATVTDKWAADFKSRPAAPAEPVNIGQSPRIPGTETDRYTKPGTVIGVLYAPRLGDQFKITITEGVDRRSILDQGGAGRYPTTAELGGPGNSVITAHRSAYGSPFFNLAELRVGDPVYVETADGWYEYRFRNSDLVDRHQTSVTFDWPDTENLGFDHLLTLITCNPKYSAWSERLVAYTVLEKFWDRAGGPPPDVAPLIDVAPNRGVRW